MSAIVTVQSLTEGIVAVSDAMRSIVDETIHLARSTPPDVSILITGPAGAGKGVIAQLIHDVDMLGDRNGRFVVAPLANTNADLFEGRINGHRRGSFTGADRDARGWLGEAKDGTLFLDEMGDMPMQAQGLLLNAMQDRKYQRLGDPSLQDVTCRFVCATNVDLRQAIADGRFRGDLFSRLGFRIHIPPLEERPEDIGAIACRMLAAPATQLGRGLVIDDEALAWMMRQSWEPGQARAVRHVVERAAYSLTPDQFVLTRADIEAAYRAQMISSEGYEAHRRTMTAEEAAGLLGRDQPEGWTREDFQRVFDPRREKTQRTMRRVLGDLRRAELIERHGRGRQTRYISSGHFIRTHPDMSASCPDEMSGFPGEGYPR